MYICTTAKVKYLIIPFSFALGGSNRGGFIFYIMKEKFFEYLEFLFYLLGGLGFWFIVIHFLHKYW